MRRKKSNHNICEQEQEHLLNPLSKKGVARTCIYVFSKLEKKKKIVRYGQKYTEPGREETGNNFSQDTWESVNILFPFSIHYTITREYYPWRLLDMLNDRVAKNVIYPK